VTHNPLNIRVFLMGMLTQSHLS